MEKQYYFKPLNHVIEDVLFTVPLCASPEGFVIEDKFEDDGTF